MEILLKTGKVEVPKGISLEGKLEPLKMSKNGLVNFKGEPVTVTKESDPKRLSKVYKIPEWANAYRTYMQQGSSLTDLAINAENYIAIKYYRIKQ